jgi:hypothetical protein
MACWEWEGSRLPRGYGRLNGKYVHRMVYEHVYGPIPPGMYVCHSCDNPPCINPKHLWLGTVQDNTADATAKGRMPRGERNGSARLTTVQVVAMREQYAARLRTQEQLAAEYDTNIANVNAIVRGKLWAHVGGPRVSQQLFRKTPEETRARRAENARRRRARLHGKDSPQ